MRYAIISNGLVINVIMADAKFISESITAPMVAVLVEGVTCAPGWTHDGSSFSPPAPAPDTIEP